MRASSSVVDLNVEGLYAPLTLLFSYRGHTIEAQARCPIDGDKTLVYGSSDSGRTIHTDVPEVNTNMKVLAEKLKLKEHFVVETGDVGYRKVPLVVAGDVEVKHTLRNDVSCRGSPVPSLSGGSTRAHVALTFLDVTLGAQGQ